MKLFKGVVPNNQWVEYSEEYYINKVCPFSRDGMFCGSWCALFEFREHDPNYSQPRIIQNCSDNTILIESITNEN